MAVTMSKRGGQTHAKAKEMAPMDAMARPVTRGRGASGGVDRPGVAADDLSMFFR